MKIEFTRDKETKNTVRFTGAIEDGSVNGSLYVMKGSELEKADTITLEAVEKAELQEAQTQPDLQRINLVGEVTR